MILKNFIVSLSLLLSIGCASRQPVVVGDVITCVHKHDSNVVVVYTSDNMRRFTLNDMTMFQIIDVNGDEVFWNIYEIENYECAK